MTTRKASSHPTSLSKRATTKQTQSAARTRLRIIGGKWRGRKIHFPDVEGLRPTPDRVRETLFNWLSGWVEGSVCVDLFAGSGALGFEAASRGAAQVELIDQAPTVIESLQNAKQLLQADAVHIQYRDAVSNIAKLKPTDILFLDPPFGYGELDQLLNLIESSQILRSQACIYLETAVDRDIVTPSTWRLHREKHAGQVAYRLFQRHLV